MRIIYLYQYFNTPSMPGGGRAYKMAHRLVAAGHQVEVVTSSTQKREQAGWYTTEEEGITVHWLPVPYANSMGYAARIRAFVRFAAQASLKAASLGGDVIFATSTPLTIAIPGVYASKNNRIPMVFEVRDLWPELPIAMGALRDPISQWAARKLERFAYRNAAHVVALSPGMAEGVCRTGYPPERVTVIPNSADLELFAPDESRVERFRSEHPELGAGPIVLYAGTLGRINGVDYMCHLAAHLRDVSPETRFVIIGAGVEEERVRKAARELNVLDENLFMYPRLPKREVVDAFAAAAVVTSWAIGIPEVEANSANKFFDGLASGTPIAINYGGWQADLLRESGAGLVLSRNPKQAAQQLAEWLANPERLKDAGRRARKLAEESFARDHLAARLEQVLVEAVRTSGRNLGAA